MLRIPQGTSPIKFLMENISDWKNFSSIYINSNVYEDLKNNSSVRHSNNVFEERFEEDEEDTVYPISLSYKLKQISSSLWIVEWVALDGSTHHFNSDPIGSLVCVA